MTIKAAGCTTSQYLFAKTLDIAWNQLATSRKVDKARLRPEIARSWERCLNLDLTPGDCGKVLQINDLAEKFEENRQLIKAAAKNLSRLPEILPDSGFIALLAGRDGTLLSATGDKKLCALAESHYLHPGVGVREDFIGTTALGLSLEVNRPVQVLLNEHYLRIYHGWCCSSAPIKDPGGQLFGVLNVANRSLTGHPPRILALTKMTAEAIEAEIRQTRLHEEQKRTSLYFRAAFESSPEALIIFDHQDKLAHLNQCAQGLLGPDAANLIGRPADSIVQNFAHIKSELHQGRDRVDLELLAADRRMAVEADLKQVGGEEAESSGIIGRLRSKTGEGPDSGELQSELRYDFQDFIYGSPVMRRLIQQAQKVASTAHTLLIEGESGTGKEILAQSIHNASSRRDEPFIAVNCAALPRELIQSELFGYEKGSFTGADKSGKPGKFESAQGGTLFLDEIGDMPIEAQVNFLRVLQEKKVVRIGGNKAKSLDVRIVSATNKDLLSMSKAGSFRSDLYYRLAVINLHIPPLRRRPEDITSLTTHFLRKNQSLALGEAPPYFSPQALAVMREYAWPGNVRELENLIIYLLSRGAGPVIEARDLPDHLRPSSPWAAMGEVDNLEIVESLAIESTLRKCDGNISRAAKLLNISRATVYKKIRKYKLLPDSETGL